MVILLFIGWLVLAIILSSVVGTLYTIIFIGEYPYYPLKETRPNLALPLLAVNAVDKGLELAEEIAQEKTPELMTAILRELRHDD